MNASSDLREALKKWHWLLDNGDETSAMEFIARNDPAVGHTLAAAARERLAQLEGGPELVERIASVLFTTRRNRRIERDDGWFTGQAKAILAALTNPTEGSE